MPEISRNKDVEMESTFESSCIVCKKEFVLWFNGGELDLHDCCGHTYLLESPTIDFVIIKD